MLVQRGRPPLRIFRPARTFIAALTAFLAGLSALLSSGALFLTPTSGTSDLVIESNTTSVLSEPYLIESRINAAYGGSVPQAVSRAVSEFNTDALFDLEHQTQDFQRRHAPEPMCADGQVRPTIESVYGLDACLSTSAFFTTSTRYERGLLEWSSRGDPATSTPIALNPTQLREAFARMRAAASALIGCRIANNGTRSLKVTVYPDSGFIVADDKDTYVLDPGQTHVFRMLPGQDVSAPQGAQPRCAFDRVIAAKESQQPYPRGLLAVAFAAALLAALVAGYGIWIGAKN